MKNKFNFFVQRREWSDKFAIHAARKMPDGKTVEVISRTINVIKSGSVINEFMTLDKDECQNLMDELYHCGIRPSQVGSDGQLGAIKHHLEDMRKLVFKTK